MSKKLALNMIVGPGEAADLNRCLSTFCVKEVFDEVVICLTSNDTTVQDIAESYATKVVHKNWVSEEYPYGDFAGARNAALDATTADWVMWLDADDICRSDYTQKLLSLSQRIRSGESEAAQVLFMGYAVGVDSELDPVIKFTRDRIFKRLPKFRWRYPVHEQLWPDWSTVTVGVVNNIDITHQPSKAGYFSAERNVRILEHEYNEKGDRDPHTIYFLARDMMLTGRHEEAIKLMKDIVYACSERKEVLYDVCVELATYYAYGFRNCSPALDDMKIEHEFDVEQWLRTAISFDASLAEPFVMLGDLYFKQGLHQRAEQMYLRATKCEIKAGGIRSIPMYREIPCARLANYYYAGKSLERALVYAKKACDANTKEKVYLDAYDTVLKQLVSQREQKEVEACQPVAS